MVIVRMSRRRAMDIDLLYEDPMDISPMDMSIDPFEQWKLNLIRFGEKASKNTTTGTGPYEGRTVQQLRATCAKKGLITTGTKAQLIRRLRK